MKSKRAIIVCLVLGTTICFTGCQGTEKSVSTDTTHQDSSGVIENNNDLSSNSVETNQEETESSSESIVSDSKDVVTDTDWYENDGSSIASGIYIVGDDLKAGSYTFTNRGEDSSMEIIIFETIDDYMGYYRTSPRSTIGEEDDAIQANSYYCTYVYPDETCSVNISDGNVLIMDQSYGSLTGESSTGKDKNILNDGEILKPGLYSSDQIEEGTYILSYLSNDDEQGSNIILFENNEQYKEYNSTDKSTIGEYNEAMWKTAIYDTYVDANEPCIINFKKDSVMLVDYQSCYIQKVDMDWSE